MALVSHRKKFIFLKTSKTAGTSIEGFLERYCLPEGEYSPRHSRPETITEAGIIGARPGKQAGNPTFWSHMPARELKRAVGQQIWDDYLKISAVRDPYDKVVSAFFHVARKNGEDLAAASKEQVRAQFGKFVREGNLPLDRDKYVLAGSLCADFIVRYERLSEDLQKLSQDLDLAFDPQDLPRYKAGRRPEGFGPEDLFDDETARLVEDTYRFEFRNFGYPLLSERYPDRFRRSAKARIPGAGSVRRVLRSIGRRAFGAT